MSHFTVLVIGDDPIDQLAPFQENNMGDCPEQYMAFNDQEDEFKEEYETETRQMVELEDGTLVSRYDDRFKVSIENGWSSKYVIPEHLTQREVPFKECYKTFEEFMADYHGSQERDEQTGRYGYWENPNAKWDWYQLGGRWTGFFKLKPGAEGAAGRPGLMTESAKAGYVDAAYKRDIDFAGMGDEAANSAKEYWDQINAVVGPYQEGFLTWEQLRDNIHKDNIDAAREEYSEQEAVKALRIAGHMWVDHPEQYFDGKREQYVLDNRRGSAVTFAMIKDGKWYERGEMGWWGIVTDEKDKAEWDRQFQELMDSLPDDTLLSVFDCHI